MADKSEVIMIFEAQWDFYKSKRKAYYSLCEEYRKEVLKLHPDAPFSSLSPNKKLNYKERRAYYFRICRRISETNMSKIPGIEKRKNKEYDVDHIVPISYGFKHKIPVELISSAENLQVITHKENVEKSGHITELAARLLLKWGIWEAKGNPFVWEQR